MNTPAFLAKEVAAMEGVAPPKGSAIATPSAPAKPSISNVQLPGVQNAAARERTAGIKGVIYGASGVGKTSLIHSLPADDTLVLDMEAGLLAIEGWTGDSIEIRQWEYARAYASVIGGIDPSIVDDRPYGKGYYASACKALGKETKDFDKYKNIFIDSITVASRLAMRWAEKQPETITKQGEKNPLKVYGILGQEMIHWLTQLQHTKNKNVWFVGILDEKKDDMGQVKYEPQLEGSKAKLELDGIVDQVLTMAVIKVKDKDGNDRQQRAFITDKMNRWGYPAKDRSGRLNPVETPHLGKLMDKIKTGARKPINWTEILEGDEILY